MHQAIHAQQSTGDTDGSSPPAAVLRNAFVINLCSSTSPVALSPPDHAGLKRFSFFVSRRREESRERFRLHMGYFDTQEEAEKLLDIVREIYPGAWAGLAPGQRLRAAAGAAPPVATEVAPAQLDQLLDATPAAAAQPSSPTVAAVSAPAAEAAPNAGAAPNVATAPAVDAVAQPAAAVLAEQALAAAAALVLVPDAGRRVPEGATDKPEHDAAARSLHDVRAAIASLDDTSGRTPLLQPIPELKPLAAAPVQAAAEISASSVLAVLEQGSDPVSPAAAASGAATTTVAVTMPAAARAAARQQPGNEAPPRDEKPYYAVQLMWSVQPMDIAQVPQLAIFSAYTLYGAEGNRDGRRWYGLRLGFFTDAVSARQVAHYVRSEFSTVSVVPVTPRERERARRAAGQPATSATPPAKAAVPASQPKAEFDFIEDKESAVPAKPGGAAARPTRTAPGKRAKLRTQSAVHGRPKGKVLTLEETLEILGASELQMDDGRAPLINESGTPPARAKPAKNKASRLGRLFERLSERMGS